MERFFPSTELLGQKKSLANGPFAASSATGLLTRRAALDTGGRGHRRV
jgi:hypothetical protein